MGGEPKLWPPPNDDSAVRCRAATDRCYAVVRVGGDLGGAGLYFGFRVVWRMGFLVLGPLGRWAVGPLGCWAVLACGQWPMGCRALGLRVAGCRGLR